MGDVRVPAVATLLAAMVAVVGAIVAVWLSGRQQRRLQVNAFAEQRRAQNAQWDDEKMRAARATEFDACVQFAAAVVIAINRLHQVADLAGRPRLRRYLLGPGLGSAVPATSSSTRTGCEEDVTGAMNGQ